MDLNFKNQTKWWTNSEQELSSNAYIERARIPFRIPSSSKKFIKDTSNDSKLQFSLSRESSR